MPFTLKNAACGGAEKRANPYAADSASPAKKAATKAPAAEQLAPRPNRPQRLPASAPLDIVICKVTKRASDVWDQFTESDGSQLWQIQVEHASRPSAILNLRDSFQDFLKEAGSDSDSGIPTSLDALQQKAGIKLVLADRNGPDQVFIF